MHSPAPFQRKDTTMKSFRLINGRILTLAVSDEEPGPRRGARMKELGVIENGWVQVRDGLIESVGPDTAPDSDIQAIDVRGRVIMPGLVDCHTHACWAGSRYEEFQAQVQGATYLQILESGGGIMSTVRAVRDANPEQLRRRLETNLDQMSRLGATTVEVKSGYGLTTEAELKMLEVIRDVAEQTDMLVQPTFLGAHAIDQENPDFVEMIINETLPAVVDAFGPIPCDAYCETGAWSLADCRRLFENAMDLGCPIRVHADQFNSLGMTRLAVEMGAVSVDHLEATTPSDLEHLARSSTIGVALPNSGFTLDDRYAPARELVDADGAIAIASNCNPGSAPTPSLPMAMALGCRKLRLLPSEVITAATWNAACVLGLQDQVGSIEPGKRADLAILQEEDERSLGCDFATAGPLATVTGGVWRALGRA